MGITVVSNISPSLAGNGASAQPQNDGSGADFAALLGQQLLTSPQPFFDRQQPVEPPAGEGDTVSAEEASALLAASGLLQAFLASERLPASASAQPPESASAQQEQIPGVAGYLNFGAGKDEAPLENASSGQPPGIAGFLNQDAAQGQASQANISTASAQADPATIRADKPTTQLDPAQLLAGGQEGETANIAEGSQLAGNSQDFAATLAARTGMSPSVRSENPPVTAEIRTPLQDNRWSQDFGTKIVWLAKTEQQTAQLNINPPQLGPMQITLNLNGDQASALFVSAHAEVRQAIADAMPQLREMLAGAGINLGEANVGAHLPQQQNGDAPRSSKPSPSGDDKAILRADGGQETLTATSMLPGNRGMVDLFA